MVDQTDKQILNILEKNSRTPYQRIAEKLQVSESMVRKRIRNLEAKGVIKQYSVVLDQSKLGMNNVVLMGVDVQSEHYMEIADKLQQFEEVKYVCSSAGDHMFMMQVLAKDNHHLSEFSRKVRALPGVTRICPAIVKETLKGTL